MSWLVWFVYPIGFVWVTEATVYTHTCKEKTHGNNLEMLVGH